MMSMSEKNSLEVAEELAKEHHEGQTRRDGEPYVSHPLSVAQKLNMIAELNTVITLSSF